MLRAFWIDTLSQLHSCSSQFVKFRVLVSSYHFNEVRQYALACSLWKCFCTHLEQCTFKKIKINSGGNTPRPSHTTRGKDKNLYRVPLRDPQPHHCGNEGIEGKSWGRRAMVAWVSVRVCLRCTRTVLQSLAKVDTQARAVENTCNVGRYSHGPRKLWLIHVGDRKSVV